MILCVDVLLKLISEQGRGYNWSRPSACPKCNHGKVWGHGFVRRLFDGFCHALLIKCYRCPECGCVMTLRPKTHFSRVQAPITKIREALASRLATDRWPPEGSPSRKRHWLNNLRRNITAWLTHTWDQGEVAGFDWLQALGIVPVSVRILPQPI
jgi:hypothetical protein